MLQMQTNANTSAQPKTPEDTNTHTYTLACLTSSLSSSNIYLLSLCTHHNKTFCCDLQGRRVQGMLTESSTEKGWGQSQKVRRSGGERGGMAGGWVMCRGRQGGFCDWETGLDAVSKKKERHTVYVGIMVTVETLTVTMPLHPLLHLFFYPLSFDSFTHPSLLYQTWQKTEKLAGSSVHVLRKCMHACGH